jgi:hypothetical protein
MAPRSRRDLLRASAVMSAGIALGGTVAPDAVARPDHAPGGGEPTKVAPQDPRYQDLVRRGHSRFVGRPDEIYVVRTTEHVVHAVREAVRSGRRIQVRSGGHCYEGFVDAPEIKVVVDVSSMSNVYYDARMRAFAVEAGATLGTIYQTLYLGWGVTIPGGIHPAIGAGGHFPGGGYGYLCRMHGLAVDHLYAIEVVVADRGGRVRTVVATREEKDPNRDLWWAHTGAGGGSFGIVTRFWFRSRDADVGGRVDPSTILPKPPPAMVTYSMQWQWEAIGRDDFARLIRNQAGWLEANSKAGTPATGLYSALMLLKRPEANMFNLDGVVARTPAADTLLKDHLDAMTAGITAEHTVQRDELPWLLSVYRGIGAASDGKAWRTKTKVSYARKALSDRQIQVAYDRITGDSKDIVSGGLEINSYGGMVNTVAPDATATVHRDILMNVNWAAAWDTPDQDAAHIAWIREFYRDVYADTGGVPVDGGSYINVPDVDLADPRWNTSGVPWHDLYWGGNYPRLQQVKGRWDPGDVFRHPLSIRLPGS